MSRLTSSSQSRRLSIQRRVMGVVVAALLCASAGCGDSSAPKPPTSKKVALQLSAQLGAGEAGRSIAVRAYYLRNNGHEEDLAVTPATIPVGTATTATGTVSVEVFPCLTDADRDRTNPATGCWVQVALTLRSANGTMISEDETDVLTSMGSITLILDDFVLPSGALVPAAATVDFTMAESGQIPGATTVTIGSSTVAGTGQLSTSIEYLSGTGWLTATIPAGQSAVTLVPTTATLAPGRYEAIVRVTSASLFTATEIHVAYVVPQPPKTVTITGAGNGTGLVLVSPNGTTCTTTAGQLSGFCAVPASYGSTVTLTQSPAVGNAFTGWSGACQGATECTLLMDQARAVTATFTILKRDLTVNATGTGSGVVTSSPSGIACTAAAGQTNGTCAAQFDHQTQVTLTATPTSATSAFTGWSGACQGAGACVVAMTEARTVTANFALIPRQLMLTMNGQGSGTVTSTPAGIACTVANAQTTGTCIASFPHGTAVLLTATPSADMVFIGWSGVCTGPGTCTVTMDAEKTITATVVPRQLTVVMVGGGAGTVTSSPEGIACTTTRVDGAQQSGPPPIIIRQTGTCTAGFAYGATVVLTVTPAANMRFESWSGACTGTEPTCTVTVDGPRTATANIVPVLFPLTVKWTSNTQGSVSFLPSREDCLGQCIREFPAGIVVQVSARQVEQDIRSSTVLFGCTALTDVGTWFSTCLVRMNGPQTIEARFVSPARSLFVGGAGTGSGTVVSAPVGIQCTIVSGTATGTCSYQFGGFGPVPLTAIPAEGSTFSGWVGCIPSTETPNVCSAGTLKVTATFTASPPAQNLSSFPRP